MYAKLIAWTHLTWAQLHYSGAQVKALREQLVDLTTERDRLLGQIRADQVWLKKHLASDADWLYEQRSKELRRREAALARTQPCGRR